jgi:hypothetical protein
MSNLGHPKALESWRQARQEYGHEFPQDESALQFVSDLAFEDFLKSGTGKEGHRDYPRQAAIAAKLYLKLYVIAWRREFEQPNHHGQQPDMETSVVPSI